MNLEKMQVTGSTPEECVDSFINTANNYFDDKPGRWVLVNWQLAQAVEPVGSGAIVRGLQQQPKVFFVLIAIFQKSDPVNIADALRQSAGPVKEIALSFMRESGMCCACDEPLMSDDGNCLKCGLVIA